MALCGITHVQYGSVISFRSCLLKHASCTFHRGKTLNGQTHTVQWSVPQCVLRSVYLEFFSHVRLKCQSCKILSAEMSLKGRQQENISKLAQLFRHGLVTLPSLMYQLQFVTLHWKSCSQGFFTIILLSL